MYIYILDCYRGTHAHVWQLYGDDSNDPKHYDMGIRSAPPFQTNRPEPPNLPVLRFLVGSSYMREYSITPIEYTPILPTNPQ